MKTRYKITLICVGLFVAVSFVLTVNVYPEPFGLAKPYVVVREGDCSEESKEALDFFRQHVSSTFPYTPKPESANSYDPVNCIWQNTVCPFEGNPKHKKFFDSKGKPYVGLVDEFGSLITCDDIVIRMHEPVTGIAVDDESVNVIILEGSTIHDNEFHLIPQEITVVLGKNNTVTWINEDDVPHTLVSDDKHYAWSTGLINPGDSSSITFDKIGVFSYHGDPGPWITGSVNVVKEN